MENDWTKPAAMAIPEGGFDPDHVEQGRYGPIFPKTPACYGFSIIAKLIPGREPAVYEHARKIEKAVAEQPDCLAVLKLHYLRWLLFKINGESYFHVSGHLRHGLRQIHRGCGSAFLRDRASIRSSKTSKVSPRIGRPIRRRSSNLSATIIARVSLNTASILTSAGTRSRRHSSSRRRSAECSTRCSDVQTTHQQQSGMAEMNATDPMAAIGNYINAFNRGDGEGMAAMFTVPGSILDGMAPHVWQGPTATQDWYRDVLIEGEQHGASGYVVTLGEPLHNNITGDSAYVVVPASMTFKVQGKQVTQTGALFTVALRKLAEGWRIAAWAWSKGTR